MLEQYRRNSSEGLVDANVELLRTALAEYPTEWRLVMALATSLFAGLAEREIGQPWRK